MFAYCLNNPVVFVDVNGEIAIPPAVYLALANGLVSFISTFAATGSLKEGITAGLQGILSSANGKLGLVIKVGIYTEQFIDCLKNGLSWEEAFLIVGITVIGDLSWFKTNNETLKSAIKATKPVLTAVFGTGKGLTITAITTGLQEYFQSDEIVYIPKNPIPSNIRNTGKSGHSGGASSAPLYKAFGY